MTSRLAISMRKIQSAAASASASAGWSRLGGAASVAFPSQLVEQRNRQRKPSQSLRWSSTSSVTAEEIFANPGKFVSGLTAEQVQADPKLQEYLTSNFVNVGNSITIDPADLELLGMTEAELIASTQPQKANKSTRAYGEPRIDKGLGNEAQQALNIRKLVTYRRTVDGTRACDRLREEHSLIPGIVWGSTTRRGGTRDELLVQTPWSELHREVGRYRRHLGSRVYDLTVYEDEEDTQGTVHRVMPRDVQWHPVWEKLYCTNFLRYHALRPIKIPLKYINTEESPALKRDGFIIPINKYVECLVEDGVPIPEELSVECTGLELKTVVRLDRVIFPDGVRHSDRVDTKKFIVGPVHGGRASAMAEDGEEEKEEAS